MDGPVIDIDQNGNSKGGKTKMSDKHDCAPRLRYAASFKERLLGGTCENEVVVDLSTRDVSVVLGMTQFLSHGPTFLISLEHLKCLSQSISQIKTKAALLDSLIEGAENHQLNVNHGGATIIVVHPQGKKARFALSIGSYHREGVLSEIDSTDIDDAIAKLESQKLLVLKKLRFDIDQVTEQT
jgi:hypothetical protein